MHGAPKYKVIAEYIYDVLSGEPIIMSDGKSATVDRRDAAHIAHKAGNKKTAEVSKIRQIVENAELIANEEDADGKKFVCFYYYEANVKYKEMTYALYVNLGEAKDGTYHIYDLTYKLRDSAHRLNDVERPVGDALEAESLVDNSITAEGKLVKTTIGLTTLAKTNGSISALISKKKTAPFGKR